MILLLLYLSTNLKVMCQILNLRILPFFKTRKELLSKANFDIFDLTSKNLDRRSSGSGSPTYIKTIVREAAYETKRPFTVLLDSSNAVGCVKKSKNQTIRKIKKSIILLTLWFWVSSMTPITVGIRYLQSSNNQNNQSSLIFWLFYFEFFPRTNGHLGLKKLQCQSLKKSKQSKVFDFFDSLINWASDLSCLRFL